MMNEKQMLGSKTARAGFSNETDIVNRFKDWENDLIAQEWLFLMGYVLEEIETVDAFRVKGDGFGSKSDIQVQITIQIKLKSILDVQNIQVKLVSNLKGFNQIDKRFINNYHKLWNIPENISNILKRYTGEIPPSIESPKDPRRMFMNEFSNDEQNDILKWLTNNKLLIVSDILKGRGKFAAEWMLVVQKVAQNSRWILLPMNTCMNFFSSGDIVISPRGSIHLGRITIQRKGGDNGRETAKALQFKINPAELFDINTI